MAGEFKYFDVRVSYTPVNGGSFAHVMKSVPGLNQRVVEDLALTTVLDLYPGCEITGILIVESKAPWMDTLYVEDKPEIEPEGETRGITL